MWRPDVIDLNEFYAGHLGQMAQHFLRRRVREVWPDVRGRRLLGFGFATSLMRPFLDEAERVIAVMPAAQGVMHWPRNAPNLVALADEIELPLPDNSIDLVLMVHCLETAEQVRPLLREVWRVLTPSGRLLAVVPNRRGLWARSDVSPFGHGYPYSPPQLSRVLRETLFLPTPYQGALYMPPVRNRAVLRTARIWERFGPRWWQAFSGVVMIEAGKQIYAASTERPRRPARLRVPRLVPSRSARGPGG